MREETNNEWSDCTVDDVVILMKNGSSAKQYNERVGLPITRIETISNETVDFERVKYIKEDDEDLMEKHGVRFGDILFSHINSDYHLGKTAIYKGKSNKIIHGINLLLLRVYKDICPDFINYQFKYLRVKGKFIDEAQRAVNQSSINQRKLKRVELKIAPLPEQRAIVSKIEELFSELDNGIKNLKIAKEKLKIYRQAVLKKAFEGELTKEWRKCQADLPSKNNLLNQISKERESYNEKQINDWKKEVKEWENSGKVGNKTRKPKIREFNSEIDNKDVVELPSLPINWFYNYLAYAGDLGRGKSKHRPRNDAKLFGGNYPFIQTGDVKAQEVITEYTQTYSDFGLAQSKLWPKGTLCITIAANIAETGFLGVDACFPDSVVGFTSFESIVDKRYIDYFFRYAKRKISAWAPATAQKNINLTILENLVIPYCSLKEQKQVVSEIETRLSICDNIHKNIDEGLEKAEALRQSILKKAFEGRLLNEDELDACRRKSDWESAEKLLERIKKMK